ncbi:transposase [Rhodococcus erythropolis]|uniref:transposase n=1 Tax=Rhodococcus erythropolis TaxID=1833 RepID=UPI003013AB9D
MTAQAAFDDSPKCGACRYSAAIRFWRGAWQEFIPFLDCDIDMRRVLFSVNMFEARNVRHHRAVKARGHFPSRLRPPNASIV